MKPGVQVVFALLLWTFSLFADEKAQTNPPEARSWPNVIQEPYEHLPTPDIGLKPLLVTARGQPVTTKETWEKQRQVLQSEWLKRLGEPPARPEKLDVKIESREAEADHVRQMVSFASEDNDRIRAYLLLPHDVKEGEKRPAVVVFHPTTNETLREPAGLGKRQEMALALQLARRGYITLSPECFIMKGDGPKAQAQRLAERRPGWTGLGKVTFDASRTGDVLQQ